MYIVVGHHGRDNQYVAVSMMNVACISITKGDVVHIPSELLRKPLVQAINVGEWSILGLFNIAVLGSSHLSGEVRPAKDGPDFVKRFCLVLVTVRLGYPITDVVLEVPITNEFLNLFLKHDTFLCSVADILVISIVFVLISFGAVSSQWVGPPEDAYLLGCQEDLFM